MDEKDIENYKKVQKISNEVLKYAKSLKFENLTALQVAETIEDLIIKNKASPAWPVNVCINDVAAHFSPVDDRIKINPGDLVKVDIGVHIDGYIWDQAFSVCVSKDKHPLIDAAEKALQEAVKTVKSGIKVCEISEVIDQVVAESGFRPIRNLTGHGIDRYVIHAPPSIPNVKNGITDKIEHQPIAIEVFVTDGSGWVKESGEANIYRFNADRPVRMWEARKILEISKTRFNGLPFSPRWIKNVSLLKLDMAIHQLLELEAIASYPVLKEESGHQVAVAETTILVD